MLHKKYKGNSITIKGCNWPGGDAAKSRRRDVKGITTHGAGVVDGMIKGSSENGFQSGKSSSSAKGRGVGTEKLADSAKEKMAKSLAGTNPERKVKNNPIKITMGNYQVTNKKTEVSGTYINNKLSEVKTHFKRSRTR